MEDWKKRVGCAFETVPTPRLLSLFFFWCSLPPVNLAPQWEHSHQVCGSQLSCSSTAFREPHKTPGTGWSQDWLTLIFNPSPAEFWATSSLSKAYCYYKRSAESLNSKARKHPSPLMWEADIDLERNGWGLCWGKPRRKSRPLHGALNHCNGLAVAITIGYYLTLAGMESYLACSKFFHFKCFLYIQQDSFHL